MTRKKMSMEKQEDEETGRWCSHHEAHEKELEQEIVCM